MVTTLPKPPLAFFCGLCRRSFSSPAQLFQCGALSRAGRLQCAKDYRNA